MTDWTPAHCSAPISTQHRTIHCSSRKRYKPKIQSLISTKIQSFGYLLGLLGHISPILSGGGGGTVHIKVFLWVFFFIYSSTLDPEVNPSLIWSLRANTEIWWVSPPTFLTVSTTQSLFTHTWAQSLLRLWRRPNSKRSEDFWCLKSGARINSQAQPRIISGTLAINSSFQVSVSLSLNWANNNTYKMELLIVKY